MSKLAWDKYIQEKSPLEKEYVKKNFTQMLQDLIQLEYSLYKEYVDDSIRNALKIFLNEKFEITSEYPELQKYFTSNGNDRAH